MRRQVKYGLAIAGGVAVLWWLSRRANAAPIATPEPGISLPTFFEMNGECRRRFMKNGTWYSEPVSPALCAVELE